MLVNLCRVIRQIAERPAMINIERGRSFSYAQMRALSNRMSTFWAAKFGMGPGDIYATVLHNGNMALFHPWMHKSPLTAVWVGARESTREQLKQMEYLRLRLVFMEVGFMSELFDALRRSGVEIVAMDPPKPSLVIHYFRNLVEDASPAGKVLRRQVRPYLMEQRVGCDSTLRPRA